MATLQALRLLAESGARARFELIPEFSRYTPVIANSLLTGKPRSMPPGGGDCPLPYLAIPADDLGIDQYFHFPVVLLHDGSVWPKATRYLQSLIRREVATDKLPSPATLEKKAQSLVDFANFFVAEDIDYLICTRHSNSPLRRYRRHLEERKQAGRIGTSIIKLRLCHLVAFFRYLVDEEQVRFAYPPWQDKESKIGFESGSGQWVTQTVTSADVSQVSGVVKNNAQDAGFEGRIVDGGHLRPLRQDEQELLWQGLAELDNTEMSLIHLNGVLCGARKQTILTWRRHQFSTELVPNERGEVALYAGPWPNKPAGADCKDPKGVGKLETLWMPVALYQRMQVYLASPQAQSRLEMAQEKYPRADVGDQYCFLSRQGNPLYIAKNDPYRPRFRTPPDGNALEMFIKTHLKPALRRLGFHEHIKFHDTRATYGMNLVRSEIARIKAEHPNREIEKVLEQVFGLVRKRMNHSDFKVTQQYLDFEFKEQVVASVQQKYEGHLADLLEGTT